MTDIVERLRNCSLDDAISMTTEAADEIERLQACLRQTTHDMRVEIERLKAEIKQLRVIADGASDQIERLRAVSLRTLREEARANTTIRNNNIVIERLTAENGRMRAYIKVLPEIAYTWGLEAEIKQLQSPSPHNIATAIREEIVRQYRDDDRGKCPAGIPFWEEEVQPMLLAEVAISAIKEKPPQTGGGQGGR